MPIDHDLVWKALSDETRRTVLDLLKSGPKNTGDLVSHFPHLSRFAVMKHLDVLRSAGLIRTRSEGRQRIHSMNVAPLRKVIERWINKFEAYWANQLLRVQDDAESEAEESQSRKQA